MENQTTNKPEVNDYCDVLYDGSKCVAKVIKVNNDNTFNVLTTFEHKMDNIPFEKFRINVNYPFKQACLPLIKYMAENHHPHTTLIITSTGAELLEGKMSTGKILDFID